MSFDDIPENRDAKHRVCKQRIAELESELSSCNANFKIEMETRKRLTAELKGWKEEAQLITNRRVELESEIVEKDKRIESMYLQLNRKKSEFHIDISHEDAEGQ